MRVMGRRHRIGAGATQEGGPLDQLGQPLQGEQAEACGDEGVQRPADEAAGVGRYLAGLDGGHHDRPRKDRQQVTHRQQEDDDPTDVDPGARARRELVRQHVDADVGILEQGVAAAQHEDRGVEIPLDLEHR
ncbi:hypothetical protein RZS08_15360, partial [Arthrospira platensis SPKY1]|nr:hypothetical protein [Arthrospira platensis SPKY1]